MKKILLGLTLILTGCSMGGVWQEEYYPYYQPASSNCAVYESTLYLINGTPSLKYICNR